VFLASSHFRERVFLASNHFPERVFLASMLCPLGKHVAGNSIARAEKNTSCQLDVQTRGPRMVSLLVDDLFVDGTSFTSCFHQEATFYLSSHRVDLFCSHPVAAYEIAAAAAAVTFSNFPIYSTCSVHSASPQAGTIFCLRQVLLTTLSICISTFQPDKSKSCSVT